MRFWCLHMFVHGSYVKWLYDDAKFTFEVAIERNGGNCKSKDFFLLSCFFFELTEGCEAAIFMSTFSLINNSRRTVASHKLEEYVHLDYAPNWCSTLSKRYQCIGVELQTVSLLYLGLHRSSIRVTMLSQISIWYTFHPVTENTSKEPKRERYYFVRIRASLSASRRLYLYTEKKKLL